MSCGHSAANDANCSISGPGRAESIKFPEIRCMRICRPASRKSSQLSLRGVPSSTAQRNCKLPAHSPRTLIRNLALIGASLLLGLVLAEIIARIAKVSYPLFYAPDEHIGARAQPNFAAWFTLEVGHGSPPTAQVFGIASIRSLNRQIHIASPCWVILMLKHSRFRPTRPSGACSKQSFAIQNHLSTARLKS